MKTIKLFILTVIAAVTVLSCTKKEVKNIISIKRNSSEKSMKAYKEFANNFFLEDVIKDNGYAYGEFFLTDYQASGIFADASSTVNSFVQSIIDNNIGIKYEVANDKNAKEYRYSYKLKNFFEGEEETDVINIKIGKKNIEAASPKILDKTFFIPADSLGKVMALIFPQNFFSYLESDFSYNTIRNLQSIEPDRASQKRYNKAMQILYKNAVIKETDGNYFIEFNNDDILKYFPALVYAVKNDNRLRTSWNIYEKMYSEEFKKAEEFYNTSIKDNIQKLKMTENLIVKNGLVTKDEITITIDGNLFGKIDYEIGDYTNPLNSIKSELNFIDPEGSKILAIKFMTGGHITNTKADISFILDMDFSKEQADKIPGSMNIQGYFYADTSVSQENFKTGMYMSTLKDTSGIDVHVSGNVEKTDDGINYRIDNMVLGIGDSEENSILLGTDANFKISKTVSASFDMPKDKINVLDTKSEEWEEIKNEAFKKLQELSMQIRKLR